MKSLTNRKELQPDVQPNVQYTRAAVRSAAETMAVCCRPRSSCRWATAGGLLGKSREALVDVFDSPRAEPLESGEPTAGVWRPRPLWT